MDGHIVIVTVIFIDIVQCVNGPLGRVSTGNTEVAVSKGNAKPWINYTNLDLVAKSCLVLVGSLLIRGSASLIHS